MKKIRKYLLYILVLFVPVVVFAADATANNWKLYCENVTVEAGGKTKCYLMAQIQNATDGGKEIKAVMSGLTGSKIFIDSYSGGLTSITASKTEYGAAFTGQIQHPSANCTAALGCYDFTSEAITHNANSPASQVTGNTEYTAIGYWEVHLDEDSITPDTDDCARLCIDVGYLVGDQPAQGVTHDTTNANATCQELKLKAKNICRVENGVYYNSEGTQVTEEEYKKSCACRISGGKYYDNNGNVVTQEEYAKVCACRIDNGKYYDGTGAEVTKEVYEKKCTCRKSDGKYYGKDGSEITKEQYDKDCVPATGSFASYAVLAAGALIALSAIMIAQKHNRFYKV